LLQQPTGKIATSAGNPPFSVAFIVTWPFYPSNAYLLRRKRHDCRAFGEKFEMPTFKVSLTTAALAALLLAGCQSSRISGIDTQYEPLPAAPAGAVQQNTLPAPSSPPPVTTAAPVTDATQFPTAPAAPGAATAAAVPGTQVASASGPDVTIGGVAGVWSVSTGGQSCKVATPQTKYGQGFRAGPLKCPGDMGNVKSWNVAGKQLVFYDEAGGKLATLYQTSPGKFDGQTTGGSAVSLSR
jgi:Protease inhibitor Inh